jgi:hypothetical protein
LTPGISSTVHIYTQTVHSIEDGAHITIKEKTKWEVNWEVRAVPRLCELYPGICLKTEEKARKPLSYGSRKLPRCFGGSCPVHIQTQTIHRTTQ